MAVEIKPRQVPEEAKRWYTEAEGLLQGIGVDKSQITFGGVEQKIASLVFPKPQNGGLCVVFGQYDSSPSEEVTNWDDDRLGYASVVEVADGFQVTGRDSEYVITRTGEMGRMIKRAPSAQELFHAYRGH